MQLSIATLVLVINIYQRTEASVCVCNRHLEKELFPCPNYNTLPVGYMYGDNDDYRCILQEDRVVAPAGWYAGIYTNPFTTQVC